MDRNAEEHERLKKHLVQLAALSPCAGCRFASAPRIATESVCQNARIAHYARRCIIIRKCQHWEQKD